ncbi:alpha/beta fold hydrolase [Microbacterium sp.]|uniref:alpha/beta fold hydrolase n=1 Tax=Microbacterium sp. TaxID=51671 RepID=UPI0033405725
MGEDSGREVVADLCRIPNPEGVDRTARVVLGGVGQFVSVRGRDRRNPVLIVCHGGPAMPSLPSSWVWQRGVEDYFTVVNYDQRGAGRSFDASDTDIDLDVDRYVDDLVELISWVRSELGVDRVALLGHSWGSIIALLTAHRRPDLLWAYVGVGQVVSGEENEREAFAHAWRSAEADGNAAALDELRALGEYPGDAPLTMERIVVCRRWAQHYGGLSAHRSESGYFFGAAELSPYYTDEDLERIGDGQALTGPAVIPALVGFDARDRTAFEVPLVQFLGRHDHTTPTAPVERWLERVTAPSKDAVWFEHSAHLCMLEEPGAFVVSLVNRVLPLSPDQRVA